MFQLEFAAHLTPGYVDPDTQQRESEQLLRGLHRTNVWLHGVTGLLVFWLLFLLTRHYWLSLLAALMFIVHPLSVECYAWLNGRMLMSSALFTIASLIAFYYWQKDESDRRAWKLVLFFLFALLAQMSKVQVGLPFLLLIFPLWRRYKPDRTWWLVWGAALILAGGFALLNIFTTSASRMFEGAEEQLFGPNLARAFIALKWYFLHTLWPAGLAPWYAPPKVVSWGDREVLIGIALCVALAAAAIIVWRKTRVPMLGLGWFLATIFATLPLPFLGPSRNLLVADRYAYFTAHRCLLDTGLSYYLPD